MSEFNYPHNNTQDGERQTRTAQFNRYRCGSGGAVAEKIERLRADAHEREIPTACEETLNFICSLAQIKGAESMLELGTGTGISGICLMERCPAATLTTVEKNAEFYDAAKANFTDLGLSGRVTQILGDAADVIENLKENAYDFIFLDSAKVQYVKYLPRLVNLLKRGGVLVADDVLLYGWVTGEEEVPPKRAALVRHIKEYIDAAISSNELFTTIIDIGDGIALSVKKLQ